MRGQEAQSGTLGEEVMVSLGFPGPAGVCRVDGGRREERVQAEGALQPLLQGPEGHWQTCLLQGLRQWSGLSGAPTLDKNPTAPLG